MLPEPFNPFCFFPGVKFNYKVPDPELTEVETPIEETPTPLKTICEQILDDIKNLPIEGWEYDVSKGFFDESIYYYHFEHKYRKYRLFGCLWGHAVPNMTLLGISKCIFSHNEQSILCSGSDVVGKIFNPEFSAVQSLIQMVK